MICIALCCNNTIQHGNVIHDHMVNDSYCFQSQPKSHRKERQPGVVKDTKIRVFNECACVRVGGCNFFAHAYKS